jgi:MFS-type transporter involved in bile tolerance (Atg22 family)
LANPGFEKSHCIPPWCVIKWQPPQADDKEEDMIEEKELQAALPVELADLGGRAYRRIVNAWIMYDWANSAFATTIMAAVLPAFYSSVAAATLSPVQASSYWGYTNTIGMLLVAVSAPILGAIADHSGSRKRFLGSFAAVGVTFTALMVLISAGDWLLAFIH